MVKRIDFHIHTVSDPSKDSEFKYDAKWMKSYTKNAELDCIAITNHNLFDKKNYDQVKLDIPGVKVFPGMELSLETGHVNIIFPEEHSEDLEAFSDWLKGKTLGQSNGITVDDYCNNMTGWKDAIYVFELGKSRTLSSIPDKLSDVVKVGGVANQLRFQLYYNSEQDMFPVLFSDSHASFSDSNDRGNIKKAKLKNTFLQIDDCSFNAIKNCLLDKTKININADNIKGVIDIDGHRVSTGINLVVGKRGTGKTTFLNKVKELYPDDLYEIAQFDTSKPDEYLIQQRKVQGDISFKEWCQKYELQFGAIKNFLSNLQESENYCQEIEDYLDSVKKYANDIVHSKSSSKYKLFKTNAYEIISTERIEAHLKKLRELINSDDMWVLVDFSEGKKDTFIGVYSELRNIYVKYSFEIKMKTQVNEIINNIGDIVQRTTGMTRVKKCNLSSVIARKQTEQAIDRFMKQLITEVEINRKSILGYQIIVNLLPFKNASTFNAEIGKNIAVDRDLIQPYIKKEYITFLKNLSKKSFYNSNNLAEYLFHKEVLLLDEDGTPASGGQAVGFALAMKLEEAKEKSVILIDEPEGSLDNAYIQEKLISEIQGLKANSMVFVVTHNSTLGALLSPDYLIVTTKSKEGGEQKYKLLSGEFTSHKLSDGVDIVDKNSFDDFVEAMEAGINTYKKKGDVYESLRN